jgi:hypothetical protein
VNSTWKPCSLGFGKLYLSKVPMTAVDVLEHAIALAAILGHANLKTVMKYCPHSGESHGQGHADLFRGTAAQPEPVAASVVRAVN